MRIGRGMREIGKLNMADGRWEIGGRRSLRGFIFWRRQRLTIFYIPATIFQSFHKYEI